MSAFLRPLFAAMLAFSFAPALHAQAAVYGTIALAAYGVEAPGTTTLSFKSDAPGFVVGGFYNFPIQSRLTAGVDLRLSTSPGVKGGTAAALAFRVGFVPHEVRLRPYVELGGGFIHVATDTELVNDLVTSGTYNNGAAFIALGLDIRVTQSIDIRALELGSEGASVSGAGYIDSGVVFHFKPHKS